MSVPGIGQMKQAVQQQPSAITIFLINQGLCQADGLASHQDSIDCPCGFIGDLLAPVKEPVS